MSSPYLHRAGASSLPNDYAIVSHFADEHSLLGHSDDEEEALLNDLPADDTLSGSPTRYLRIPIRRRTSLNHYGSTTKYDSSSTESQQDRRPSFASISHLNGPSWRRVQEQDALLANVPRMEEPVGYHTEQTQALTEAQIWIQEAKIIWLYTLPVFGTHALEYSLSVASVVSIGHISTTALAAATLGSMTSSVTGFSIILGFVSALDSLLPQAWTSNNPTLVGLWSQRMVVLLTIVLIPIFIVWFNAEGILLLLNQEAEVAYFAGLYLKWLSLGLPAYAFNSVARRYLQSQGLPHIPTMIVSCVAPINIVLNYVLVWGPSAIRLGFIGAPIATAISFNLISIGTCIYAVRWAPRDAWYPLGMGSFRNLGILVHLGLAGVCQLAAEWWSWELVGLAASYLGPIALAAQSVLLVSCSTTYQAPYALSVASSVRIGNMLGVGNTVRARVGASVSMLMSLGFGLCCMAIFIMFRNSWAYIFSSDPEVVSLVAEILPLVAVFQIFDALCGVTAGILRARGRPTLGAVLNFISYYIVGIPCGLLLTFKFNMGVFGLWIGLASALLCNSLITTWIVLLTDWDLEVLRAKERLGW